MALHSPWLAGKLHSIQNLKLWANLVNLGEDSQAAKDALQSVNDRYSAQSSEYTRTRVLVHELGKSQGVLMDL